MMKNNNTAASQQDELFRFIDRDDIASERNGGMRF